MKKYNPRSLDSLGQKHWSIGQRNGMFTWGWSRDWKTISPWSFNQVSLPYVGVSRRYHGEMVTIYLTIGPAMLGCHWIKANHSKEKKDG